MRVGFPSRNHQYSVRCPDTHWANNLLVVSVPLSIGLGYQAMSVLFSTLLELLKALVPSKIENIVLFFMVLGDGRYSFSCGLLVGGGWRKSSVPGSIIILVIRR